MSELKKENSKVVPDIDILKYKGSPEKPDIKIFVSHRIDLNCETIDNPMFVDVRCGSIFDDRENVGILGDDTGDHISEKRMSYCELTVQYWAWKNVKADYYGLCHYRRYLNFSKYHYSKDEWGHVVEREKINSATMKLYGYDEVSMTKLIEKYDIVVADSFDVSKSPNKDSDIRSQWISVDCLDNEALEVMTSVIADLHPGYLESTKVILDGSTLNFCNLFVMKKSIFMEYSQWLFSILFEVEKKLDFSSYSVEGQRIIGHLGERLLGIYINHLQKQQKEISVKELQPIIFLDPVKVITHITPLELASEAKVIPLVLSSSDEFLPICYVAIHSILKNANPDVFFELVILSTTATQQNKEHFCRSLKEMNNANITFLDVTDNIKQWCLLPSAHISTETYYRFLIPDILKSYDKVLYLDSDIICLHDIEKLFEIDIGDNLVGAIYDPDLLGTLNQLNSSEIVYNIKELGMDDPYAYFQAGVLIMNTKEFRKLNQTSELLQMAGQHYRYVDQDILNKVCYGRVHFIDMGWNVMCDCQNYRVPVTIANAPASIHQAYHKARENPYIVHYAGCEKPWNMRGVDLEHYFWKYARETPFYEELLLRLMPTAPQSVFSGEPNIGVKGALKIYIRKKGEKLCPKGTRRRKIAKKLFGWMIK